ncbi:MAG TPA: recombinase family protein [Ktedonobacteraceae bacterium]
MTRKQANKQVETERVLRVAAYLRVSTEDQAESGLGIGSQEEKARAVCTMKGWPVPTFYVDNGISGKIDIAERVKPTTEHPTGSQLVKDIQAGLVDVVIVAALDRIGRKALYILNFVALLGERVQLFSAKETIDTSTPTGKFMVTIMAGLAELERDTTSQRTIDALDARGRSVGIRAGLPPYGYHYDTDIVRNGQYLKRDFHGVSIVPEQAEVVRKVYELREQGLTLRAIAERVPLSFNAVKNVLDRESVYRGGLRGESEETWPIILESAKEVAATP